MGSANLIDSLATLNSEVEVRGTVVSDWSVPVVELDLVKGPGAPRRITRRRPFAVRSDRGVLTKVRTMDLSLELVSDDLLEGEWRELRRETAVEWLVDQALTPDCKVGVRRRVVCAGDEVTVRGFGDGSSAGVRRDYRRVERPPVKLLDGREITVWTSTRHDPRPPSSKEIEEKRRYEEASIRRSVDLGGNSDGVGGWRPRMPAVAAFTVPALMVAPFLLRLLFLLLGIENWFTDAMDVWAG